MPKLFILLTLIVLAGHYQVHSQNNQNTNSDQQKAPNQNVTVTSPVRVAVEPDVQSIESEKAYKERQEKRDETNATWNRIGIVISSLLFVLVLIQAYISHRQLNSMDEALRHTKSAFFMAERAYVGLIDLHLAITEDDAKPPVYVGAEVINGGRTPANDLHTRLTVRLVSGNAEIPTISPDGKLEAETSSIFLPAGGKDRVEFPLSKTDAGKEPMIKLKNGTFKLYVFFEATYLDIENQNRTLTEFCVYRPSDGKFQSLNAVRERQKTATLN